jgi:dihydroflavonol-4-reductase
MKVAITGASGHIGNCLVRELSSKGIDIKVLVHKTDSDLQKFKIEFVKGDILEMDSLNKLCDGVDIVYHLAGRIAIDKKDREIVYQINFQGTKNIANACIINKVKRLVYFSSIHALVQQPADQVLDETRALVDDDKLIYDLSKADSERYLMNDVRNDLDTVVVNPTAVIGPFDFKGSLLGQALIKIYSNKLPMLLQGGYDWVDVRDVVQGAVQAAEKGRRGERYLLSGTYSTLRELSRMIGKISGKKTTQLVAPMFVARIGLPFISLYSFLRKEQALYTKDSLDILENSPKRISSEKARKEFNYQTRPLRETLNDTFKWYEQENLLQ